MHLLRFAVLALLCACHPTIPPATGPNIGALTSSAVIDCTGATAAPSVVTVLAALQPLVPNWTAISASAKSAGATIGGCAFAQTVEAYMTMNPPPAMAAGNAAYLALEAFRADVADGASFKTASGYL